MREALKVQPVVRGQELRGKTSLSFGSRPPEVIRLSRHEKSRGQAEGMPAGFPLRRARMEHKGRPCVGLGIPIHRGLDGQGRNLALLQVAGKDSDLS